MGLVARIRIIDEWLRSPVSPPTRARAVMVVADTWSEQRVLMRAYAASDDQTRPCIVLHGQELAIGPAGASPHGSWGIHVEPPVDGRAQELRSQLELAAKRLAGSKGNPPRLIDEVSRFDDKATNMWAPGTPPDVAPAVPASMTGAGLSRVTPQPAVYERPLHPPMTQMDGQHLAAPGPRPRRATNRHAAPAPPPVTGPRPTNSAAGGGDGIGSRTRPGFLPDDHQETVPDPAHGSIQAPPASQTSFASLVGRTMPIGLTLTDAERDVLNALGRADFLTASEIGSVAGVVDPVSWMEELLGKLAQLGLDLVIPGPSRGAEPSYRLRR